MIALSIKNSLLLLQRTYKQLLLLWLVFFVLIAACGFFISGAMGDLLNRRANDLLANLESQVSSDLRESETALRSASLNIEAMIRNGRKESELREYIEEFNGYALAGVKHATGVTGVYGVFNVFDNVYINASGQLDNDPTRLLQQWYGAAVAAKGKIAVTLPYQDAADGERKVTFSRTVYDKKGKQAAVIGLDMRLSGLKNYIDKMRSSNNDCYGMVVDSGLNIIVGAIDEIFGQPLSVLKSPDIYRIMAELNKGVDLSGYKTMNTRDGGNEPILVYSRQLENGWRIGVVAPVRAYYRDMYDEGATVIVLGLLLQFAICFVILRIAAGKMKADERSDRKSNFLANMSHEIRTPMNAIIGFAELALREDIPPTAYEHIFTIKQAGANLLSIINDILDFSKIESGKFEIVPGDYLFSSLLNDVVSIIKMRATYAKLRFVVNADSNIPNALYGDEVRVRQVLLNLLSNAVKYTDKGFVSLSIDMLYPDDDDGGTGSKTDFVILKITVADSGKGIKSDDVDKLFKAFVQVDKEKNKGVEGTGLGLAIINSILKAMGGKVAVASEYGKGSTFTVTLPQRFRDPGAHAVVEDKNGKNALIYERRDLYANSIVRTVRQLGVNCAPVDSEAALDEKVASGSYNFVFTASALYERTKNILQKHNSNAKVVLLTEFGDVIADKNVTVLSMPAYSVTAANVLNGHADNNNYGAKAESFTRFIAPDARVLVVDDANTNLRVAEGLLSPYKMRVDTCKSGPDAIAAVQAEHYDIVFMDHMMPGMDGIETADAIRALGTEYAQKMPIIALTANAIQGTEKMFYEHGFQAFISKPIDIMELDSIIRKWVRNEEKEKELGTEAFLTPDISSEDANNADITIDIPGVDTERGISLYGGDTKIYLPLLRSYAVSTPKILEKLGAVTKETLSEYVIAVHGLKGTSANIGAEALREEAFNLEKISRAGDIEGVLSQNNKLIKDAEVIVANIKAWLERYDSLNTKPRLKSPDREVIARLRQCCENFNMSGIDKAMSELDNFAYDEGADLIAWLKEKIVISEIDEMAARLARYEKEQGK